jgi:hypothetical protein
MQTLAPASVTRPMRNTWDTGMHAGARGARQIGTISRDNIGRADESE